MRLSIFFLALSAFAAGQYRSIVTDGSNYASGTINVASRTEIEFTGCLRDWSTGTNVLAAGTVDLQFTSTTAVRALFWPDPGNEAITITIPSDTTALCFRMQRETGNANHAFNHSFFEVWTPDGKTRYIKDIGSLWTSFEDTNGSTQSSITTITLKSAKWEWLNISGSVTGFDQGPPRPDVGGDLAKWTFEGNLNDSSGNSRNLSATGSPTYATTTMTPMVGEATTARAGEAFTLDCRVDANSYQWTQTAGPSPVKFSSRTSAQPTVTGAYVFGQYEFRCDATNDGASTAASTAIVGVVPTNAAGVVIVSDSVVDALLGPIMIWKGSNGFKYTDRYSEYTADYQMAAARHNECATAYQAEKGNYYDAVMVYYQMYFRTGLTRWKTRADTCADSYWTTFYSASVPCSTSTFIAPRNTSMVGLILRSYLAGGDTTKLGCFHNYQLDYWNGPYSVANQHPGTGKAVGSWREMGYSLINAVALAVAHHDSATRAAWVTRIENEATDFFRAWICKTGRAAAAHVGCLSNYVQGVGTVTITNGSTSMTGSGTSFQSFLSNGSLVTVFGGGLGTYWPNEVTISSCSSDTACTLTANATQTVNNATVWAKDTQNATLRGGYRELDVSGKYGWADQVWHSALVVEGCARAHRAGIATSSCADVINDYAAYLLDESRAYNGGSCTYKSAIGLLQINHAYSLGEANGTHNGDMIASGNDDCTVASGTGPQRALNNTMWAVYGYGYMLTPSAPLLTRLQTVLVATHGQFANGGDGFAIHQLHQTGATTDKDYGQALRNVQWGIVGQLGSTAASTAASLTTLTIPAISGWRCGGDRLKVTIRTPDGNTTTTTITSLSGGTVQYDATQGTQAGHSVRYTWATASADKCVGAWQRL